MNPRALEPDCPVRAARQWARAAFGLAALLLALAAPASPTRELQLDCANSVPVELTLAPAERRLQLTLSPTARAWLWIEEAGQDLRLTAADGIDEKRLQLPPRYGLSLLSFEGSRDISIERLLDNDSAARVHLGLECQRPAAALLDWLSAADSLTRHFGGGLGSLRGQPVPSDMQTLIEQAPAPRWRAFALHGRAQWLLLAGLSAEATPAFIDAAAAWDAVGARAQAAAARVAAAETLRLAARGAEAIALSRAAPGAPDPTHYFGVRLEAARCGALFEAGALDAAAPCYAWVQDAFAALGEPLEAANSAINEADLLRREGEYGRARSRVLQALEALNGPQSDAVRGRAELSLAETAAQQGDTREVLQRLQLAQRHLHAAGESRWQAHVLRRLATVLLELGSSADAQLAVDAAQALLDPAQAPLPFASGQLVQARLLRAGGRPDDALALLKASLAAAQAGSQRELLNLALLEQAAVYLDLGQPARALATLDALQAPSARERARADHYRALANDAPPSAALIAHAFDGTFGEAATAPQSPMLGLSERIDVQRLAAHALATANRSREAQARLLASAQALSALRLRSGNPLLADALDGLIIRLRGAAIELLSRAPGTDADSRASAEIEALVLDWLVLTLPLAHGRPVSVADALDAEIGRLLLGEPSAASSSALLAALAVEMPASADASFTAKDLRASFVAQAPLRILLAGEQHALSLQWQTEGVRLQVVEDLPGLRTDMRALSALAQSPQSSLHSLQGAAAALAARLRLEPADDAAGALHVLADGLALQVEWSLLPDGSGEGSGSRRPIRLLQPAVADSRLQPWPTVQLLQAAQWQNAPAADGSRGDARLPALQAAAAESALIRSALPGRSVDPRPLAEREALLKALASRDGWLHISAHGQLQPGLLAGSGLWLDPAEPGAAPQYMSALDARARGVRASHVVLNACQLAANAPASAGLQASQTSFAHSLVAAGAEHVIAARWPVSDSASHVWVPAYYRALQAQADSGQALDPGAALLAAQRALQRSRAFRHPFHWGAWVHLQRLPLIQAAAPGPAPHTGSP
jgi:hypothetical protein